MTLFYTKVRALLLPGNKEMTMRFWTMMPDGHKYVKPSEIIIIIFLVLILVDFFKL